MKYRPEIDGLRAVAVGVVVLYHAGFLIGGVNPFQGGFIGVDIFFVISGYLITSILLREMEAKTFTFASFYERRARRILPALFLVIVMSMPFAWAYLSPKAGEEYAGSILATLGFGSNIWFWLEDSYWAEPSQLKPFLHTWSLAIEEQFYILFPPLLLLCLKFARPYVIGMMALVFLLSLILAHMLSRDFAEAAFYLLPMRAWELLGGSILAAVEARRGRYSHPLLNKFMPFLGIFLILHAAVSFHDGMRHPSLYTLEPVIGAMLLIWFSRPGEFIGAILSSRPFVGLGLISYSLYLWHFPLFAFARIKGWGESDAVMAGLIFLSVGLSVASYYLVEQPARNKSFLPLKPFLRVISPVAVMIGLSMGIAYQAHGFARQRLPEEIFASAEQVIAERKAYRENLQSVLPKHFSKEKISVVVIGNSFAIDVSYMFSFNEDFEVHIAGSTSPDCIAFTLPKPEALDQAAATERCARNIKKYFKRHYRKADAIVLADQNSMWTVHPLIRPEIEKNFDMLRESGFTGPIIVYGERPKYKKAIFEILREHGRIDGANQYAKKYLMHSTERMRSRIATADAYYESIGAYYYAPVEELCTSAWCQIVSDDGKALYHDNDHFSLDGDRRLSKPITDFVRSAIAEEKEITTIAREKAP